MTRRGKIVCTLGPATGTDEMVNALVEAGMDVARLDADATVAPTLARFFERRRRRR